MTHFPTRTGIVQLPECLVRHPGRRESPIPTASNRVSLVRLDASALSESRFLLFTPSVSMDHQRNMRNYTKTVRDGSSLQSFQPYYSLVLPGVLLDCLPHEIEVHQQDIYQYIPSQSSEFYDRSFCPSTILVSPLRQHHFHLSLRGYTRITPQVRRTRTAGQDSLEQPETQTGISRRGQPPHPPLLLPPATTSACHHPHSHPAICDFHFFNLQRHPASVIHHRRSSSSPSRLPAPFCARKLCSIQALVLLGLGCPSHHAVSCAGAYRYRYSSQERSFHRQ